MKKYNLRWQLILAAVLLITAFFVLGWQLSSKMSLGVESDNVSDADVAQELEIYFYQNGGIYKLSSSDPEPVLVVSNSMAEVSKYGYQGVFFDLMGPEENWLVYLTEVGKDQVTGQINFSLVVYDLEQKTELLRVNEPGESVTNFIISPSGQKLAYIQSKFTNKPAGENQEITSEVSLFVWEGSGEPKKLFSEKNDFSSLLIGMWLDETNLTAGRGYEGVQYCLYNINSNQQLSNDDCSPHYGRSMMGIVDQLKAVDSSGLAYGFRYEYEEIIGNKQSNDGIFSQDKFGERKSITSDVASDLVVSGQNIYYLRNGQDASKHMWNGSMSDLYLVTTDGATTRRLTNDSNSVSTKSNLNVSSDGRFVSYQVTDLSKVSPETNSLFEQVENSSVWLYDTLLNKYYQVAESAVLPKVVLR